MIVDSGVQSNHPFLLKAGSGATKVQDEACFSTTLTSGATAFTSLCPLGAPSATGPLSAAPCTVVTLPPACDHGTHVAGIAVGRRSGVGSTPSAGVAPGADLLAVEVYSKKVVGSAAPVLEGYASDLLQALGWVDNQAGAGHHIAAVNLSLGTSSPSMCDAELFKPAIDNLRSKRIATVVAAGDEGLKDSTFTGGHVSWPACLSNVVAVGATDNADVVAPFSNSSGELDLLGPGVAITSSGPGSAYAPLTGTSMAAAHVTGAMAVMRAMAPAVSVSSIESQLRSSGRPIPDAANGIVTPRIRLLAGTVRIADTGFSTPHYSSGPGVGLRSTGTQLRPTGAGALTLSGVPAAATVLNAYLYYATLGGPDNSVVFDAHTYTSALVGASRNTCENFNQLGPIRVYRVKLPFSILSTLKNTSPTAHTISGVGPVDPLAQGASLVVAYAQSGAADHGEVVIREGAKTVHPPTVSTFDDAFPVLPAPTSPVLAAQLHLGIAAGDTGAAGAEEKIRINFFPLTLNNAVPGPWWTNKILNVPTFLFPVGTLMAHPVKLISFTDCMAFAYTALAYHT